MAPKPMVLPASQASSVIGESARDQHRCQVAVGVAHGHGVEHQPARASQALGAHPRQRRVPRQRDAAVELRLDLALVIGIKNVVERQAVTAEVFLEAFPDRHDLGRVGHRAHHQRRRRIGGNRCRRHCRRRYRGRYRVYCLIYYNTH
jgi:hypothetical protein